MTNSSALTRVGEDRVTLASAVSSLSLETDKASKAKPRQKTFIIQLSGPRGEVMVTRVTSSLIVLSLSFLSSGLLRLLPFPGLSSLYRCEIRHVAVLSFPLKMLDPCVYKKSSWGTLARGSCYRMV